MSFEHPAILRCGYTKLLPKNICPFLWLDSCCKDEHFNFDINRAAEKILGFKKEELIGRNVWDVFPALAEPGLLEAVQQGFARERPVFLPPLQYREGDDVWIWHYLFKLPSGELASLMIDVSTEVCDGNGPPSSPGIR